jgi:hypothetical protein
MSFNKENNPLTLGFANWPNPIGPNENVFARLLSLSLRREVLVVADPTGKVDICIESVYARNPLPTFESRAYRFLASHTKSGIDFSKSKYSPNQQPSRKAKYSIFFTGENERPPYGDWDCYLSFDLNSYGGKNAYLPLWWITSSDLIRPTVSPYLGRSITLEEMLASRESNFKKRNRFCVAFIGKAYPFRMQAIAALSAIGKVDVFGGIARNSGKRAALEKYETSQKYKFVFAFENDLFPGYVTEKAPEAWATGAIPLYWGSDPSGYLNQDAMINLANYQNLETFTNRVHEVSNNPQAWHGIASQPILRKRPNLDEVLSVIRTALAPLVRS